MAFDGVLVRALADELNRILAGSRLSRIQETERDELLLTFTSKSDRESAVTRVFCSANAALPLVYRTDETKESPLTAPNFCMVLRKHLQNGKVIAVKSDGFERVLTFSVDHLNEMGDLCRLRLILELMGKHSNILLVDEKDQILDAIRHVSPLMSSVRTVLPGKPYYLPDVQQKKNAETETMGGFRELVEISPNETALSLISGHYAGFSGATVSEVLFRAGMDAETQIGLFSGEEKERLCRVFLEFRDSLLRQEYCFEAAYQNGMPKQFAATELSSYRARPEQYEVRSYPTASDLIRSYYGTKVAETRIRNKAQELRKNLKTLIERTSKKLDLQNAQFKDTENRDKFRLYGELLSAYSYSLPVGEPVVTVENYHDGNKPLEIPVDPALSIADNAKRYYQKYARLKRTYEALSVQKEETLRDLEELESLSVSLEFAESDEDLSEIREELASNGFIKKRAALKKDRKPKKSRPWHYRSSDGFDLYVGKNNLQNEELTFRFANGNDYFFHAKKTPGSHVILRTEGKGVPDRTFEEAASLAAYYSTARENTLVEVDYVLKKEVKKVPGQKPGFVIYDTNYSMMVSPDISRLTRI
ncbi:MAG: NFACT family protein [Lachnospiraceae bacterium]|nr:NFACT family protein [Lachnospiraceae bacterium]